MGKNAINQEDIGPNNMSRRTLVKGGIQSMVAGIVGLAWLWEAQDQTVAVATTSNNFPWRNLETTKESGFTKAVSGLQAEIIVLEEEFQKWKISSKEMQEMLAKLLLNEKTLMDETQKALDIIWAKLERTYTWLPEGSKEKESVKKLWSTVLTLKTHLAEDFNLIKAIRLIYTMSEDETYRNETTSVNRPYFKGIAQYVDKITTTTLVAVQAYEKSFDAQPTDRMGAFKDTLVELNEKIGIEEEPKIDTNDAIAGWKIDERMFEKIPQGIIFNKKTWTLLLPNTSTPLVFKREFSPGKYNISFTGDSADIKVWFWNSSWQSPLYIKSWESVVLDVPKRWQYYIFCAKDQKSPIILESLFIAEIK